MAFNLVHTPPSANDRTSRLVILLLALFGGGFLLLVAAAMGMMLPAVALSAGALLMWGAWCYPLWGAVALVILVPLNRFVLLLLYNVVGASSMLRAFQLWDDALIVTLALNVAHQAFSRRSAPRFRYLDLLVAAFILFTALYMFYPGTLDGNTLMTRFSAFRFDALFLLGYFIGRGLDVGPQHVRWLLAALVPCALVVGAVALWQWVAPGQSNSFFDRLSFSEFSTAVGGSDELAVLKRDLAGSEVPRSSSLLLGYLGLAFYQMLVVPFAAAFLFVAQQPRRQWLAGAFLVGMVAVLALTVTRSAVLATAVSLVVVTVWARAYPRMLAVAIGLACAMIVVLLASGYTPSTLREMISTSEPSVQGHASAMQRSIEIVRDEPLGRGLGSAGPISQRVNIEGTITNESWYLQLATEMGMVGGLLFAGIVVLATASAFVSYLKVTDHALRILTIGMAGAGLAFMIVGAVLHVWEVSILSMLFWLFAGIAVRAPEIESQWNSAGTRRT